MLDNYDIGGKFREAILNKVDMLPDITRLGLADATPMSSRDNPDACGWDAEEALVAFILALTDPRMKKEAKPFDHPQLFILVDGTAPMLDPANPEGFFSAHNAQFQELPATEAAGRCRP